MGDSLRLLDFMKVHFQGVDSTRVNRVVSIFFVKFLSADARRLVMPNEEDFLSSPCNFAYLPRQSFAKGRVHKGARSGKAFAA
jgi:hypothetical protein